MIICLLLKIMKFLAWVNCCKIFVRIIGSRKYPILPMILEPVEGKPIDRTSLMVPRSGLMSSFLMVKFLGRYSKNMMIEKVSDMMLIRIYPITAIRVPYFINFGKISRTTSSLNSCSRMFDTEWGIICCLPKKYPLMILDRDINGRTSERAING